MNIIQIKFDEKSAEFLVDTDKPEHLVTALIGLEGYLHKMTGLDEQDIRGICREAKDNAEVKPTGGEVTDIEVVPEAPKKIEELKC